MKTDFNVDNVQLEVDVWSGMYLAHHAISVLGS